MADRYWLGNYAGAVKDWHTSYNWSATSGGARLATGGVPTSSDNVYFDGGIAGNGNYDCDTTNAVYCNDITTTSGYTKTITWNNSMDVYGSLSFHANLTVKGNGLYGVFNFKATTTGKTITTGGNSLLWIQFDGVGGEWTLGDALTCGSTIGGIIVYNGTFKTNGYAVSALYLQAQGTGTKTINLSTSTITLTGSTANANVVDFETYPTGLTLSVGSASFTHTGVNGVMLFGTGTSVQAIQSTSLTGYLTLSVGTCTNLNLGPSAYGQRYAGVKLACNVTCSTAFYTSNTATDNDTRFHVCSTVKGTQRTFSLAAFGNGGTPSRNIDWEDIAVTGAASPLASGTHHGDGGNNSGINPRPVTTMYAKTAGNWSSTGMWVTTSGGSTAADVPICHDFAVFDGNSGAGTYTIDVPRIGDLSCALLFTRTIANSGAVELTIYKGLRLRSGMTLSFASTGAIRFRPNPFTVWTYYFGSKTFSQDVYFEGDPADSNGSSFQENLTTTGTVYFSSGLFSLGSNDITCVAFMAQSSYTMTLGAFSGCIITCTGTGTVCAVNGSGLTFDSDIQIVINDNSATQKNVYLGGVTINKLTLSGSTGSCTYYINGSPTITTLQVSKSVACTITLEDFFCSYTFGTITGDGSAGNLITLNNAGTYGGTSVTILPLTGTTPCILNYWNFTGIHAGRNGFAADTPRQFDIWYGTDGGNNSSNIRFFPRDVYKGALTLLGAGT